MDETQLRQVLLLLGMDEDKLEDVDEWSKHVRTIEFNNNTAIFISPLEDDHKLIFIDFETKVIGFKSTNRGRWRPQYKTFTQIEAVIGLSRDKPDDLKQGWVEEFENGGYYDHGKSPNNQDFKMQPDGTFVTNKDGKPIKSLTYCGAMYDTFKSLMN